MYNEQWQLWEQKPYQHKQIRRQHIQWCTDIYMSRRCSGNELSRDKSEVWWYSCKGWRQGLHTRQCLAKRTNQTKLTKESNSDPTNTRHSMRKVYFRMRQSVIWCRCRLVKLHQCYTSCKPLFYVLGWNVCHARYEKPLKNHPWVEAKKCVETYSPPNAVVRNSGERVLHL